MLAEGTDVNADARHAMICLRVLVEELAVALNVPEERYERIARAMTEIDERLKRCDELEKKQDWKNLHESAMASCPTCAAPVRFDHHGVRHYVGK